MSILVTVVIPAYKRPELLRKAVLSTFDIDFDPQAYEVIVVDSSPNDANRRIIEELQTVAPCSLRFFHKKPEGPGPSRNLGVHSGTGQFIAFLDSDCQASPGWLRSGVAGFAPEVGIVQGRTAPDPLGETGVLSWYVSVEQENFFYETCNIFYRRTAFEQAGGFAGDRFPMADVPLGGEDVELAWKVKRLGWRVNFSSDALVYHEVIRISVWRWICERRLFLCPEWVRRVPELRQFFVGRYFYDWYHAYFALALIGLSGAVVNPWLLLLCLPYVLARSAGHTKTLRGPLRLLRVVCYVPRDATAFILLAAGSIRARRLLL